jgi:hypothetical protein
MPPSVPPSSSAPFCGRRPSFRLSVSSVVCGSLVALVYSSASGGGRRIRHGTSETLNSSPISVARVAFQCFDSPNFLCDLGVFWINDLRRGCAAKTCSIILEQRPQKETSTLRKITTCTTNYPAFHVLITHTYTFGEQSEEGLNLKVLVQ